jgi:hypothetical protein
LFRLLCHRKENLQYPLETKLRGIITGLIQVAERRVLLLSETEKKKGSD